MNPGPALARRYHLPTSHRPGIIPLRPLGLGDILDGAVKNYRRNPRTVAGVAAVTNALALLPAILVVAGSGLGVWLQATRVTDVLDLGSLTALLLAGGTSYAVLLLTGLLAHPVGDAILGRRPTAAEVWAAVRDRIPRLLVVTTLVGAALAGPSVVWVIALILAGFGPAALVVVTAIFGGAAAAAATLWLLPHLLLAVPVLVLERRGIVDSVRRGWTLSTGRRWGIVGIWLLATGLALIVFWAVQVPMLFLGSILAALIDPSPSQGIFLSGLVANVSALGAATLVSPFLGAVAALLYVDTRIRNEGFDVVLMRTAAAARPR